MNGEGHPFGFCFGLLAVFHLCLFSCYKKNGTIFVTVNSCLYCLHFVHSHGLHLLFTPYPDREQTIRLAETSYPVC